MWNSFYMSSIINCERKKLIECGVCILKVEKVNDSLNSRLSKMIK